MYELTDREFEKILHEVNLFNAVKRIKRREELKDILYHLNGQIVEREPCAPCSFLKNPYVYKCLKKEIELALYFHDTYNPCKRITKKDFQLLCLPFYEFKSGEHEGLADCLEKICDAISLGEYVTPHLVSIENDSSGYPTEEEVKEFLHI